MKKIVWTYNEKMLKPEIKNIEDDNYNATEILAILSVSKSLRDNLFKNWTKKNTKITKLIKSLN